jgi:cation diffusion facilitator family transporter
MEGTDRAAGTHSHDFVHDTSVAERQTRLVIAITATMMIVEIVAGVAFRSMALLADGWHMSTHVGAFLIAAVAYHFGRRHARDPRYSFGTGKMGVLGGFASAVVLAVVALLMAGESVRRLFAPLPIRFDEAIPVTAVGLAVNLVCAYLLRDHHHGGESGGHGHHHHDLNLRSAHVHVLADALTSVTALIALLLGRALGWNRLDPAMGLVGSVVVAAWAYGLLRDTSGVLLDRTPASTDLPDEIRRAVEEEGDARIADLHVWQVAAGRFAAIVSIVARSPRPAEEYRKRIDVHEELVHVSVEVRTISGSPEGARADGRA